MNLREKLEVARLILVTVHTILVFIAAASVTSHINHALEPCMNQTVVIALLNPCNVTIAESRVYSAAAMAALYAVLATAAAAPPYITEPSPALLSILYTGVASLMIASGFTMDSTTMTVSMIDAVIVTATIIIHGMIYGFGEKQHNSYEKRAG